MAKIVYANQGATRSQPLTRKLESVLSAAADAAGVDTVTVFSGGQPSTGSKREGSHRHDEGNSGDIHLSTGGRLLDYSGPADQGVFSKFINEAAARGITGIGIGKGYMDPGSTTKIHVGYGPGATMVWGDDGKGANAPQWARDAFGQGQQAVKVFQQQQGLTVDGIVGPDTWGAMQKAGLVQGPSLGERAVDAAKATGNVASAIGQGALFATTGASAPSEQIKALQNSLASRGFDPGPMDGVMGLRTQAALDASREAQTQAGRMGMPQQAAAAPSERVRVLQNALASRGFDPGPVNGINGPQTERAVQDFLADVNREAQTQSARMGRPIQQNAASAVPSPFSLPDMSPQGAKLGGGLQAQGAGFAHAGAGLRPETQPYKDPLSVIGPTGTNAAGEGIRPREGWGRYGVTSGFLDRNAATGGVPPNYTGQPALAAPAPSNVGTWPSPTRTSANPTMGFPTPSPSRATAATGLIGQNARTPIGTTVNRPGPSPQRSAPTGAPTQSIGDILSGANTGRPAARPSNVTPLLNPNRTKDDDIGAVPTATMAARLPTARPAYTPPAAPQAPAAKPPAPPVPTAPKPVLGQTLFETLAQKAKDATMAAGNAAVKFYMASGPVERAAKTGEARGAPGFWEAINKARLGPTDIARASYMAAQLYGPQALAAPLAMQRAQQVNQAGGRGGAGGGGNAVRADAFGNAYGSSAYGTGTRRY